MADNIFKKGGYLNPPDGPRPPPPILIEEAKNQVRDMRKANVDLFPAQLYLQCGSIEIRSDGKPQHTTVLIDGKPAKGIYSLKINLNTQRPTKIELGVFLDEFEFNPKPKKEVR